MVGSPQGGAGLEGGLQGRGLWEFLEGREQSTSKCPQRPAKELGHFHRPQVCLPVHAVPCAWNTHFPISAWQTPVPHQGPAQADFSGAKGNRGARCRPCQSSPHVPSCLLLSLVLPGQCDGGGGLQFANEETEAQSCEGPRPRSHGYQVTRPGQDLMTLSLLQVAVLVGGVSHFPSPPWYFRALFWFCFCFSWFWELNPRPCTGQASP